MNRAEDAARGMTRVVLLVAGMRDNACRERVAEVLGRVEGVVDVSVSLMRARGVVRFGPPCDEGSLIRAVACAGYEASVARNV